jgi:hypothetical protein
MHVLIRLTVLLGLEGGEGSQRGTASTQELLDKII